jgi:hypothetical protein
VSGRKFSANLNSTFWDDVGVGADGGNGYMWTVLFQENGINPNNLGSFFLTLIDPTWTAPTGPDLFNPRPFDQRDGSVLRFCLWDPTATIEYQKGNRFEGDLNSLSAVPEPSTLALLGIGLGGIGFTTWRKKK